MRSGHPRAIRAWIAEHSSASSATCAALHAAASVSSNATRARINREPRSVGADFSPLGVAVGHATDEDGGTGLTVVRVVDATLRGAATVVGRATGTRELQSLSADSL